MIKILVWIALNIASIASQTCTEKHYVYKYRIRDQHYYECLSCINFIYENHETQLLDCKIEEKFESEDLVDDILLQYPRRQSCCNENLQKFRADGIHLKIRNYRSGINILTPVNNQWDDLWVMDLSGNNISQIADTFFDDFIDLIELKLDNNLISSINSDCFHSLTQLQKLSLSKNNIVNITANSFEALQNLFEIDLSYNQITYLPADIFSKQLHLELVVLSHNFLVNFEVSFKNISPFLLPSIDLSYNKIKSFHHNDNFLNITLTNNGLANFSINVSSTFVSINLSSNEIQKLSEFTFSDAVNLEKLDLSHNFLESIPTNSFRKSKLLKYIDISHNLLSANNYGGDDNWISFFSHLKNLKYVSLDSNLWKCSDLKDILSILVPHGIDIRPGSKFLNNNILGIECINTLSEKSLSVPNNYYSNISATVIQRVLQEFRENEGNYTAIENNISNIISRINQIENNGIGKSVDALSLQVANLEAKLNKVYLQIDIDNAITKNTSSNELVDRISSLIDDKSIITRTILDNRNQNNNAVAPASSKFEKTNEAIETKKLLHDISLESNGKAGEIIHNIFLFAILCCLGYLLYANIKRKNRPLREEVNLV